MQRFNKKHSKKQLTKEVVNMEELQIFNNEEFGNVRSLVIDN